MPTNFAGPPLVLTISPASVASAAVAGPSLVLTVAPVTTPVTPPDDGGTGTGGGPLAVGFIPSVDVPHLAWPLRRGVVGLARVEQDSLPDVQQAVLLALNTPVGTRPLSPASGVDDPTFGDGVDPDDLASTLAEQEPRATLAIAADEITGGGEQTVRIEVSLASAADDQGEL